MSFPSFLAGLAGTWFLPKIEIRENVPLKSNFEMMMAMIAVEITQIWMPGFTFDYYDVFAVTCGGCLALTLKKRHEG